MVCAICIAPILAAAGVGGLGSSAMTNEQKYKQKILLWVGIVTTVISIGLFIYWLYKSNTEEGCTSCQAGADEKDTD